MTIELSREGGDIRLFITLVPKVLRWSFNIRWLNNFRHFHWILIGWFINLSVQRFQPLWTFYRSRSFVYYLRRCTSIYRPLSYPFRSLINNRETKMTKLIKSKLWRPCLTPPPPQYGLMNARTSSSYKKSFTCKNVLYIFQ